MYDSLSKPWQVCAALAWEAYCAGSLAIAAVVADEHGEIVATGRNRIADTKQSYPRVSNHALAHAELNALLTLDETKINPRRCTLYTTTEPCPLCMGAIRMMGIPQAYFAARDPWAGCSIMTESVPYIKAKKMQVHYEGDAKLETLLAALLLESIGEVSFAGAFSDAWVKTLPDAVRIAQKLFQNKTLRTLKEQKASVNEMFGSIEKRFH